MNSPRRLGADISAATLLLFVLIPLAALPPFLIYFAWFLPIPLSIFSVHQFRWTSRLISLIIGICLAYGGLGIAGFVFAYAIYILSQIMADSIRKGSNPYQAIVLGTITFIMLFLVLLARLKWGGIHFYTELSKHLEQSLTANPSILKAEKTSSGQLAALIINQIQLTLPGVLCIIAFLLSSANLLSARILAKTIGEKPPILLSWKLPYGVIFVYIISLTFVLFGSMDSPFWSHVFNSAMLFTGFLIGIQGLAYAWRRLYGHPKAKLWMTLLFIAVLIPIVRSVYILIGLIDSSNRTRKI